jgi:hypothetical protein
MEDVGTLHDHLVYIHILRPFGIFCGHLVYVSRFGMFYREKSGNPSLRASALFLLSQTKS